MSFDNTNNTYDAGSGPIQSFGANNVGGLAISSDGYLYISTVYGGEIYRVSLTDLTTRHLVLMTGGPTTEVNGLAVSNDGKTLFYTCVNPSSSPAGVYSLPTTGVLPVSAGEVTPLDMLGISEAIDIAIMPIPTFSISPPTGLTGSPKKE